MKQQQPLAEQLAKDILAVGTRSETEEDVRIGVEKVLGPALKALDISTQPRYEKATSTSFYDAIHGRLILEYKRPRRLGTKSGQTKTLDQLVRYLIDEASQQGESQKEAALKRMVAVSIDGFQILFVRYTGTRARARVAIPRARPSAQLAMFPEAVLPGGFDVDGPHTVNSDSISLFLTYVRALRRYPLTPEDLTREFGPDRETARQIVDALYRTLIGSRSPKVDVFFREWQRIFGVVYGQDVGKAEKDASQLAERYGVDIDAELQPILFAVHTYYALLMKLLVAELLSLQPESYFPSFVTQLAALSNEELQRQLTELEDGGHFQAFGIQNFLEGDFFGWYLADWNEDIGAAIRHMAVRLSDFEPATAEIEPEATRDLLKRIYQYLVPKKLRHDLGEYYTPDWLAERLLNQVGYEGNPDLRILDPACGSGTFLALAIKRIREYADEKLLEHQEVAQKVLQNVVGFDLNPLAVIAARTTYLLALGNLRRAVSPITIPVYMCDSILTPTESSTIFGEGHKIPTTVGEFLVPKEMVEKRALDALANLIEVCVRDYSTDEFIGRVHRVVGVEQNGTESALRNLFEKIKALEQEDRNRIWARILKNAFAPVFQDPFDYVVGNPPWVNWESLSDEYREATKETWEGYELQPRARRQQFALGKVKRDISMLFVYVCADQYLKPGGRLGFLITQTVFKTEGGEVFRQFQLGEKSPLRVLHVDDMVELKPFEGASNWTSAFVCIKGEPTRYPVPYTVWRKHRGARITMDDSLEEVENATTRVRFSAMPIDPEDPTSAWITATKRSVAALSNVIGPSPYEARAGAVTWADGIYLVQILDRRPDGLLVVQNLHDIGKRTLPEVKTAIESDLVHPFVQWRDISRWHSKPSCHIVLPHTLATGWRAIAEDQMKSAYPKTYAYFKQFETVLKERSGYKQLRKGQPFYIMSNTGPWLFAPVKVVWKRMTQRMEATVVEETADQYVESKPLMHKETVTYIPVDTLREAHFLCALLNSTVAGFICASYSVGKSFGSPHIMKHIAIPEYSDHNPLHGDLSALSTRAHELAAQGERDALRAVEETIDNKAAELWGITKAELKEIGDSLDDLT